MRRAPSPNRGGAGLLAMAAVVAIATLVLAPNVIGAWLGGLIGHVWATAIAAIAALLGGMLGGALQVT